MSDAQLADTGIDGTNAGDASRPKPVMAIALSVLVAAVGSVIADVVIASTARAVGASHAFQPLTPAAYVPLTILGIIFGAVAWQTVRAKAKNPTVVLGRLVPIVVVLSLIPDVLVGAGRGEVGTSWGAVAALMVMHLAVATIAVTAFRRWMPLR
jgi:hypothetical protein